MDSLVTDLGIGADGALAPLRLGAGWHRLSSDKQIETKLRLVDTLSAGATRALGQRFRAHRTLALIRQYYRKAKDGRVKRRQAVSKAFEPDFAACFGGDWTWLLTYLGEAPHPDEQIVTAIPEPRIHATPRDRVGAAAAQLGIPVEEAERMVAAFWQGSTPGTQSSARSPVERRTDCLTRYWDVFDAVHARQAPGMPSLWGLVEDGRSTGLGQADSVPYRRGLYRRLLPAEMLREIEALWGTVVLPRWPHHIVTEPYPHLAMADAFGPALRFWHGCALTAWFVCEGPMSRTDVPELGRYYAKELADLAEAGTPVAPVLFDELLSSYKSLPEETWYFDMTGQRIADPSRLSMYRSDTRRRGFNRLRDIITAHRRAWGSRHLSAYLRVRWESALRDLARTFSISVAERGKPPTVREFSTKSAPVANAWFGGDVVAVAAAIGERAPLEQTRVHLLTAA